MCGIIGIKGNLPDVHAFEFARDAMMHRGPDDTGTFRSETDGIMLGHRRLSIIDLSAAGHQPFSSVDGRYVVVFNGEIYNYLELRAELEGSYRFQTKTDTEVLLASYIVWKEKCLERLNGMFAFAVWDSGRGILFCARDRLGEKPFFYSYDGQRFTFASEIKSLLSLGVERVPDERMIHEYLVYGQYDHTANTFFRDVKKLPPGHYLTVGSGSPRISRYWDLSDAEPAVELGEEDAAGRFEELLADSIRLRYRSDVPVGLNLSSGLDSNSLYQYSFRVNGAYPSTFSMCLPSGEYDECEIISGFLSDEQKKGWNTCTVVPDDIFPLAEKMNRIQDQPFGGIPTIAYAKLVESARDAGVTVLLEGQGLDEILAGYKYYEAELEHDRAGKKSSDQPMTLSQDMTTQIFPEIIESGFRSRFAEPISFEHPFDSNLLNAQYRDLMHSKLPRVLRFNDHATMAYGRELRLPYLDHRIVEFCFWLPPSLKIDSTGHKALMRRIMKGRLPAPVHGTPKKAFGAIQTEWFRKHFHKEIMDIIGSSSFASRSYWDHAALDRRIGEFFSGKGNNSFFIWQCINLELWFRAYID